MKTVIFSDTHLTHKFDKHKFAVLEKIIEYGDRVIINGDFWDHNLTTFDRFIKSPWQKLFPLLKEKEAFYIFGNHDEKEWSDDRVNLFSTEQGMETKLKADTYTIQVEHGQRIVSTAKLQKNLPLRLVPLLARAAAIPEQAAIRFANYKVHLLNRMRHNKMRAWARANLGKDELLICGHSHYLEFNLEDHYINCGFVQYGRAYFVVIDDDVIELKSFRY